MHATLCPRRKPVQKAALWFATTCLSVALAHPGLAQEGSTAGPAGELAGQEGIDPPAIVGSVSSTSGNGSFHAAGETKWSRVPLNFPVTSGEGFWTEPLATATIEIADDRVVMDESTQFDVSTLDQSEFVATEAQGAVFLQLNSLPPGQLVTINTPRGAVQISATGRYEIVAGDTNDATTVTVVEGAAHIAGANLSVDVGPGQSATITGSDEFQGNVGEMAQDAFLTAQLHLPPLPSAGAVPRDVRYMTGGTELSAYGSWSQTEEYGQVWYPASVPATWAPYRDGHWAYVQPWGWTWVDNARWGFAPFHYGRWVEVNNRWGWIAGGSDAVAPGAYPAYSPALVAFIGVSSVAVGFSAGLGNGLAPAWVPLGPKEPYYPWFHCRTDYFARVNSPYGVPHDIVERGPTYITNVTVHQTNIFINQRAATVVPAAAFVRGQPVMAAGRPLPQHALAGARSLAGRLPATPTAQTPDLSPETAHRFNLALPAPSPHTVAPGPHIVTAAAGTPIVPELRKTALPANARRIPPARIGLPAGVPGPAGERPVPSVQPRYAPAIPAPTPAQAARPEVPATGQKPAPAVHQRPKAGEPATERAEPKPPISPAHAHPPVKVSVPTEGTRSVSPRGALPRPEAQPERHGTASASNPKQDEAAPSSHTETRREGAGKLDQKASHGTTDKHVSPP